MASPKELKARRAMREAGAVFGRELAEQLIPLIRRGDLTGAEAAVLFGEDLGQRVLAFEAAGENGEHIACFSEGAGKGYGERIDEETAPKQ